MKNSHLQEIYKLSTIEYTYFIKALTRHYIIIMTFHTQILTKFSGFHFKDLQSTDGILNEILHHFLIKDQETIELKQELASFRPDHKEIMRELIPNLHQEKCSEQYNAYQNLKPMDNSKKLKEGITNTIINNDILLCHCGDNGMKGTPEFCEQEGSMLIFFNDFFRQKYFLCL